MSRMPMDQELAERLEATRKTLESIDQTHLLDHAEECSKESLEALLDQCDEIDLPADTPLIRAGTSVNAALTISHGARPKIMNPHHAGRESKKCTPTPSMSA